MKRALLLFLILLCFFSPQIFSLELELIEGVGNLAYNTDRTSWLSDESSPGTFTPNYFPLILARVSGEFNGLTYNAGYARDPVLRNRLFANIKVEQEYFYVEGGAFIGLLNTWTLPVNPGISASLGLMLPGIVYLEASGSSTLAAVSMEKEGNYYQITKGISIGFWVPHVICSLNMNQKNFAVREETFTLIDDELTRYYFRADVFTKNVPYTIRIDLGYQNHTRSYSHTAVNSSGSIVKINQADEFKSIFMGLEGTFTINPVLKILLGAEMPVYSWAVRPMKDPPDGVLLFEARMGLILTL